MPVGSLKPNDLGLFDSPGNVIEWCQEVRGWYPEDSQEKPVEDHEQANAVSDQELRVLRGGSFVLHGLNVRAACRNACRPSGLKLTKWW